MERREHIERVIDRSMHRLRCYGNIREARISHSLRDTLELDVELSNGEHYRYELTRLEIVNGETERWLDTVERDIMNRARRRQRQQTAIEIQMRGRHQGAQWARHEEQARSRGNVQQFLATYLGAFEPQEWGAPTPKDPAVEKRSQDLFILVAGNDAFDTLEAGKPLPMTGSSGTAYWLHKRASYCVERVKDGATLCAVVPSVPLFDHLLGIKLMVEHDEPKFLETANAAINNYAFTSAVLYPALVSNAGVAWSLR